MKEDLEGLKESDFKDWLDLIFGKKQRYLDYKNKEGQFFRTQCYIDVDKNTSEEYSIVFKDNGGSSDGTQATGR